MHYSSVVILVSRIFLHVEIGLKFLLVVFCIPDHGITFEGFVTTLKYSCDSTINRKMSFYEDLTSSDVLILIQKVKLSLLYKGYLMIFLN